MKWWHLTEISQVWAMAKLSEEAAMILRKWASPQAAILPLQTCENNSYLWE